MTVELKLFVKLLAIPFRKVPKKNDYTLIWENFVKSGGYLPSKKGRGTV
jgi:hypothetical protein